MPGAAVPFFPHTCFALPFVTPFSDPPSFQYGCSLPQVFPTWLSATERNHRKKKSHNSHPFFVFLLHTHSLVQSQGRLAKEFCSSYSWIILTGLSMLRLAGTFPSRWNVLGGQDTSLQGICQEIFSRDIWLDEILANFRSKRLFFHILLQNDSPFPNPSPTHFKFQVQTWPSYIFSIC